MSNYSRRLTSVGSNISRPDEKQLVPCVSDSLTQKSHCGGSYASSRAPPRSGYSGASDGGATAVQTAGFFSHLPPPGYFNDAEVKARWDAEHGLPETRHTIRRTPDQPTFRPSNSNVAPGIAKTVFGPGSEAWTAASSSSNKGGYEERPRYIPPMAIDFTAGQEHPAGEVSWQDSVSQAPSRPSQPWPTAASRNNPTSDRQLSQQLRPPGGSVASGASNASTRISTTSTQINRLVQQAIEADRRGRQ